MGVIMAKITISGHPGSGTSTLVEGLVNIYNWNSINGGQIFRNEAASRNMPLSEFGKMCSSDESIDRSLDEKLKGFISADEIEIIESRLAGWWGYKLGHDCIRVWLKVDEKERARRVVDREGGTSEEALIANSKRLEIDTSRYKSMYGITPEDNEPYTHIIDATEMNTEEVIQFVAAIIEGD